jgi:hypothetical protein
MKLLYCKKCGDIFNLTHKEKICSCGETSGLYIDNINAEIKGDCIPLGFANSTFRAAFKIRRLEPDTNPLFTAFFIPENAESVRRK